MLFIFFLFTCMNGMYVCLFFIFIYSWIKIPSRYLNCLFSLWLHWLPTAPIEGDSNKGVVYSDNKLTAITNSKVL